MKEQLFDYLIEIYPGQSVWVLGVTRDELKKLSRERCFDYVIRASVKVNKRNNLNISSDEKNLSMEMVP